MNTNYHTHTKRCGHSGNFEDEEYVISAINNGFKELGFTEHAMFSDIYNEYGMRPPYSDLDGYIESINNLKEKYKDQIKIYCGMECEYFKEYYDELKKLLDDKKMDYLIFGNHFIAHKEGSIYTPNEIWNTDLYFDLYMNKAIEAMESKLFKVFAHPDFVFQFYDEWNEHIKEICLKVLKVAKENDVYLEINIGGFRRGKREYKNGIRYPFPYENFWKLVNEVGNKVIIGVDAHNPLDFGNVEEHKLALDFANKLNIKVDANITI
jgi:histidinol-phosphatase (PHP family)